MNRNRLGTTFIKRVCDEAFNSTAINHPYLQAMREGDFPNVGLAFKDFALEYGFYSKHFVHYLSAVIKNLRADKHKQILLSNLAEEEGNIHDIELPPDVLESIEKQAHTQLFRRFQMAIGIDFKNNENLSESHAGETWSQKFLHLCQTNECVGVGAIGIGTELIVSKIYNQILEALKAHSSLTVKERVFFDLHSECDQEHAAQMLLIAEELAIDQESCNQIKYGVSKAVEMRTVFWDVLLERAHSFPVPATHASNEEVPDLGHQKNI